MNPSRLALALTGLVALGGVAWFAFLRPSDAAARTIVIEPDPLDFGDVPWLDAPHHTVRIVNRSDREVLLRNPHLTCACFSITTPIPAVLRPGASGTFEVQMWTTKGAPGRFHKELLIETDDPSMPTIKTPVIGAITDYRSVSPTQVVLGKLEPDSDPVEKKVEVRGGSGYAVTVTSAKVDDKRLTAEVREVAGGADVIVRTIAKPSKGYLAAQVLLSLDVEPLGGPSHRYTESVRVSGEFR